MNFTHIPDDAEKLADRWRKLADSWLRATNHLDTTDSLRERATTRSAAYKDCADDLEAMINQTNEL